MIALELSTKELNMSNYPLLYKGVNFNIYNINNVDIIKHNNKL